MNAIIRAEGRFRSTSIWGSGDEGAFAGRLFDRRGVGVEGADMVDAIIDRHREGYIYCCHMTIVVCSIEESVVCQRLGTRLVLRGRRDGFPPMVIRYLEYGKGQEA